MASVSIRSDAASTATMSTAFSARRRNVPPPPPPARSPSSSQIGRKYSLKYDVKSGISRNDDSKAIINSLASEYPKFKTSMCFFFNKGRCANGKECRFAHGCSELKQHQERLSYNQRNMNEAAITGTVFLPPPPSCKPSNSKEGSKQEKVLCNSRQHTGDTPPIADDRSTGTCKLQENSGASWRSPDSVYHTTVKASPAPTTLSEINLLLKSPSLTLTTCSCQYTEFCTNSAFTPRSCVSPCCGQDRDSGYSHWDHKTEQRAALSLSPPIRRLHSSEDGSDVSTVNTCRYDYEGSCFKTAYIDQSASIPPFEHVASAPVANEGSRDGTRQRVLVLISQLAEATAPFRTGYYPHMDWNSLPHAEIKAMQFNYLAALTCLNPLTSPKELQRAMQNIDSLGDNYD